MQNQVQYSESIQGGGGGGVQQQQTIGDSIYQLPSDTSVPSHNEIRIVDQFFQQKKSVFDHILRNTKDMIILGALFIVFSLPFIDNIVKKFVTITSNSPYILIGVKTLLFVFAYFIIKNIYLVRKNNV
jgi:hypothetical protein